MEVEDVLSHYGIPGMRWGHKKGNQTSTKLEKIKRSDLEEIDNLFNKLSTKDRKFLVLDQKLPLIKKNIRDERHCFVSRLNGKVVGFIRESGRPNGFTLLEELVVDPDYRNKGIASKMIDDFNSSFPKTLAKTKANNTEINNLLKKKGYKPDNPDAKAVINWSRQENPTQKSKQIAEKLLDDMGKEEDQGDVKHGGDIMEVDDVLMHFGILGMHWGHRKGTKTPDGATLKPKVDKKLIKADKKWAESASSSWVQCHNAGTNEMNSFLDSLNKRYSGKLDKDMWDKSPDKWSPTTKAYIKEYDTAYQNSLNAYAKNLGLSINPSKTKELRFKVENTEVSYDIIDRKIQHGGIEMEVNEVLAHYGIPGMRWGVRRGGDPHMLTAKRQLAADKKLVKKLDDGKHLSIGFGKKRQAAYDARDRKRLEGRIAKNEEKLRPSVLSDDHTRKTTIQKKRLEEMSNKELRELNERLQLERNYRSLKSDEIAPGKKFVNDVVKESGKEVAKQYTKKYMVSAVEALLL